MFKKKREKSAEEMENMSALEEKVDALLRYCAADSEESRARYRRNLQRLVTVETPCEAMKRKDRIDRALADLGIPDHLLGYNYLQTAIEICLQNPEGLGHICAFLYPTVAQCYDTSQNLVERGIRNAIECGWSRCDLNMQKLYFGGKVDPIRGKPSNKEFITRVCHVIQSKYC